MNRLRLLPLLSSTLTPLVGCVLVACAAANDPADSTSSSFAVGAQIEAGCTEDPAEAGPPKCPPIEAGAPPPIVNPPVDWEAAPGPPLVSSLSTCPGTYATDKPIVGLNSNFVVEGQSRNFSLLLPPSSFTGPRPLMIGFNGTGGSGAGFVQRLKPYADEGFIVVAPSSIGNGDIWPVWDALRAPGTETQPNKDLAFFDALVGCLGAHYSVDKSRIFVSGHSAGGAFANKVLRARSTLLAGGIVASGVFSLTSQETLDPTDLPTSLDPMFVIVTWGGDNDEFSGAAGGISVSGFNFVEEASLASRNYAHQPGGTQVACHGDNAGHRWLPAIDKWAARALVVHHKWSYGAAMPPFPTLGATCSEVPYEAPPLPEIACNTTPRVGCRSLCEGATECLAENRTVRTTTANQLATIGIQGQSCDPCLAKCEAQGSGAANAAVLTCLESESRWMTCGPGVEGALPYLRLVDTCCQGHGDASLCVDICTSIVSNSLLAPFAPSCQSIAP